MEKKQWNDNIADTKKCFNFRIIFQNSDETNHQWKHNDLVPDSDTAPLSREINRKNYIIQIGVMQNFSRLSSIQKHFRTNILVTNNILSYEK